MTNKSKIKIFITFLTVVFLSGIISESHGQFKSPEDNKWWTLVEGTVTYRTDGTLNPVMDPNNKYLGTFYGADVQTDSSRDKTRGWNSSSYTSYGRTSGYEEIALFGHPGGNGVTAGDITPGQPLPGWVDFAFTMNGRFASPHAYRDDPTADTKYPLIVFLHGVGESADCRGNCRSTSNGELYNNDHQLYHGGTDHLDAINRDPGDIQHWGGFVLYPQIYGKWAPYLQREDGSISKNENILKTARMIETFINTYPIDPNRIYIHGLSNGGDGNYYMAYDHFKMIAAMAPMSGSAVSGYEGDYGFNPFGSPNDYPPSETLVHIPIRQFQGGQDKVVTATPQRTANNIQSIYDAGGNIQFELYPGRGHNTWGIAYDELDFFSWFSQYSKLSIHSFFGIDEICDDTEIKLGISPGFNDYEWEVSTNGGPPWQDVTPIDGRPNEILATEAGFYRVRFLRDTYIVNASGGSWTQTTSQVWTEWSEPFELKYRERPKAKIETNGSWVLWGLDNNTSLTLSSDFQEAEEYVWTKNGGNLQSGADVTSVLLDENGEGVYTLEYTDNLCPSLVSDPVYISREPTSGGEPVAPGNFEAAPSSESSVTLGWRDNAVNEIGYEIYRSLDGGATYVWVENIDANLVAYEDIGVPAGVTIYYQIRAFNENGASGEVTTSVDMPDDNNAPEVPQNFSFERFSIEEFRLNQYYDGIDGVNYYDEHFLVSLDSAILSWSPVAENTEVYYDIYSGTGALINTTTDTSFIVPGLQQNEAYSFYIKTRDINGLESPKTETVQVYTAIDELYYIYYIGAIWDEVAEYSIHNPIDIGTTNNFEINKIPGHDETDYFAYDFIGYIEIDQAGTYNFRTRSDDGSSVWIGNNQVVDNDGVRDEIETRSGFINFTSAGIYPITVKYFERVNEDSLSVLWRPPGQGSYSSIPDSKLTSSIYSKSNPQPDPANLTATANGYSIDLAWNHPKEQVHVVILGSSTAAGADATSGNSWVDKFETSLEAVNPSNTLTNLAVSGFTTYSVLPSGVSGQNITAALAENPDIIIVNLPSNDRAAGYDLETVTLANFQTLKAEADAAGVEIYFTTTQPRNFSSSSDRDLLATEATRIRQLFGAYAINIYDELADVDGYIKVEYETNDNDGIHLNDAGHDYLYSTIWNKVNNQSIPVFEVFRSENGTDFNIVSTSAKQQVSLNDNNLQAETEYFYKVRAVTQGNNSDFSNTASATTGGDSEPPTIPQNFRDLSVTDTQITLAWQPSTDNVSVAKYVVMETSGGSGGRTGSVNGKTMMMMGETDQTSITLTGLTPLESLTLVVYAEDPSGNKSPDSNEIVVQTNAPLPVEFLDVSYRITDDGVLVTWATASELNNAFFTVERGTGLDDFTEIGAVEGSGTTSSRRDYILLDSDPLDLAYYRIKQTDFDGQYDYSKIIRVVYNEGNLDEFTVYPNPTVQENINARGFVPTTRPSVEVKLLDVMGKVHMNKVMDPNEFLKGLKINLDYALPPGVYIIQISDGATNTQRRVVIR